MKLSRIAAVLAVATLIAVAVVSASGAAGSWVPVAHARQPASLDSASSLKGIHKIKHIVIIMQENRSFDNYFGTYPGADGIPGLAGNPGTVPCVPDPQSGTCVKPFHDRMDKNIGGLFSMDAANADIDGGKMDGFIGQQEAWFDQCGCGPSNPPDDVMGYHTKKDIRNYWAYAKDFVLQDHMFMSVAAWSLPSHLFLTSGWSARCTTHNDPSSCQNAPQNPDNPKGWGKTKTKPIYAWTDLTYLLHKHHVSWRYYYFKGNEPACESNATASCKPVTKGPQSDSIWYPIKWFDTVKNDKQTKNVQSINGLFSAAQKGKLPSVSWVVPSLAVSEHSPELITPGQTYVTGLINTIMQSPDWKSTAIFLSWDDWGGFYDNMVPPVVDENGYGLRVPGLVISPYAKKGYIDHQVLSFDAYLKFIEDDFLGGERIDPATDGRPDPRPDVRENESILGNLIKDFDFKQKPRAPVILPVHPKTDLIKPRKGLTPGPAGGWG